MNLPLAGLEMTIDPAVSAAQDTAYYTLPLAIFTFLLVLATAAIAYLAQRQLSIGQKQQRKWATLAACDRWDIDNALRDANKKLKSAIRDIQTNPLPEIYAIEYVTIFNYFDSIAIGIKQEFYEQDIVLPHLGNIMSQAFKNRKWWPKSFEDEFERDYPTISDFYRDRVSQKFP